MNAIRYDKNNLPHISRAHPKPTMKGHKKRRTSLKLGALATVNPKRARKKILDAIALTGTVVGAARKLRISDSLAYSLIRRLGISELTLNMRKEFKTRFRLPPRPIELGGAIGAAKTPTFSPKTPTAEASPGPIAQIQH